jgi:hypothetical protein
MDTVEGGFSGDLTDPVLRNIFSIWLSATVHEFPTIQNTVFHNLLSFVKGYILLSAECFYRFG